MEGTYLISARQTSSLYNISPNGTIIWTLTGHNSGKAGGYGDFYLGPRTNFAWQHHARWRSSNEISLFDNGYSERDSSEHNEPFSRALRLLINTTIPGNYTVSLLQELINDKGNTIAELQGSFQFLPNGNYWVSYGNNPLFTEFSSTGEVVSQFQTAPAGSIAGSYRAYKHNFTTNPSTIPDIAVKDNTVYMSWNGASRVFWWDVFSGSSNSSLEDFILVQRIKKTGFETKFILPTPYDSTVNFTRVEAIDVDGNLLKSSRAIREERRVVDEERLGASDQIVFVT